MNLKFVRVSRGMTQNELAEKANISVRYLQNFEQGAKNINGAKLKTLLHLAIALDCEVSEIVTDEELIKLLKTKGAN